MDKEIKELAEIILRDLPIWHQMTYPRAEQIAEMVINAGYRKPSNIEEIAERIYEFVHRGKVHLSWNELPLKYGKKEYLELARSLLPEMKLIGDDEYCSGCPKKGKCKIEITDCKGFIYWRLGTQAQLASCKEKNG